MRQRKLVVTAGAVLCLTAALARPVRAQDNYEIQVYGSDLVPVGDTMVEFHSNFTLRGTQAGLNDPRPARHAWHETLEITHGFTDWFEVGFYTFTSAHQGSGWEWVGNHVRPRFSVPARLHWPVGLSLSQEFGYQRAVFSPDTWTWEVRPIVDQKLGRFYWSLNPVLERSFKGPGTKKGFEFSPNAQITWDFTPRITGALEYYGALGSIHGFDAAREQVHLLVPSIDLNLSPLWEFNLGIGLGLTSHTDGPLIKAIVGRRFGR
jgi:hypothetical protein